jgi:Flp pilus assembly protein TadG
MTRITKKSGQAGALTIELALLMVPLIMLLFGITEFGRALYQYNTIAKGVRDGVRHLSQYAPGDPARINEAKCLAVFGTLDCNGTALVSGLTTGLVTVSDRSTDASAYQLQETGRGALNLVAVSVDGYVFDSLAPLFVPDIAFASIGATMVQTP